MESLVVLPRNALAAADQIIDEADSKGVRLRLVGGLAFKHLCPSASDTRLYRENKDIDLIGRRDDAKRIVKIMETLGYKPREMFNRLSMGQRLIYYDMVNKRRVDIFLDEFVMCHRFDFRGSLLPATKTLPITELVMTKLQVVEMTQKEHLDLIAAFSDFDVSKEGIDGKKIAEACSRDWGLYTTFSKSIDSVKARAESLHEPPRTKVVKGLDELKGMMQVEPKSFGWKVRARIGEKAKWYELPETDSDAIFA